MRKNLVFACLMVVGALPVMSCDDGTTEDKNTQDEVVCQPECASEEQCDNGVCKCGENTCGKDETCQAGECKKTDPSCEGESCEPPEDPCNGACKGDEVCADGVCKCGDEVCAQNEQCQSGHCEKDSAECEEDSCVNPVLPDSCNGECSEEENCVDGICKCGDEQCGSGQMCQDGVCKNVEDSLPPGKCEPACTEGTVCVDGECQPDEIQCEPECTDGMICVDGACLPDETKCSPECENDQVCVEGQCQVIADESCHNCLDGETCVSGVCMCGKSVCGDNQVCQNDICVLIDPCEGKECPTGQVCSEGKCKLLDVSFNKSSVDIYLSSKSPKIIATRTSTKSLTWTLNGIAASDKITNIRCITPDKTYSQYLKDCIVIDKEKKTETIQFIGLTRKPKTMKLKVVDDKGNSAETELKLKPYFGMDSFVKLDSKLLIYKNGIAPGPYMTLAQYTDKTESEAVRKANLCGKGNDYCRTSFDEEDLAIFDADMYTKFIRPKMLKYNDKYYGTRASVVAAARFLILQFPYDLPYARGGAYNVQQGRGHYMWAYWARDNSGVKSKSSEAAVFGLNLTPNDYNSSLKRNSIWDKAVPWGAYDDSIPDTDDPSRNNKYKFNGLECSGFVTWALRNGRVSLGDWTTHMFARDGSCVIDGKKERSYKCKTHVNHLMNKIPKNDKGDAWGRTFSNSHNALDSAYEKLNKLKNTDFKQLDGQTEANIKEIFNDAKAGDLLWRGSYIKKAEKVSESTYYGGHIAMVIGLKRDKNGDVTEIEVGEAVSSSGNKLRRWTISSFVTDSVWVAKSKNKCASFLIKMDNVYNYYSDKYKITTEGKTSDCKDGTKSGGNCYLYSDMYNETFNDAIKIKEL